MPRNMLGETSAASVTWIALANLNAGVTSLGDPFLTTIECAMVGESLKFKGNLACPNGSGTGFRLFDLPVGIAPPTKIRRLYCQTSGTSSVGLNLNPDGTVTVSGSTGTFVILDDKAIEGWG